MRWLSTAGQRGSTAALLAVAVLIPLAIAPGVFFHFDVAPKIAALLVGVGVALACRRGIPWPPAGPQRRLAVVLLVQAVALLLAWTLSADRALSLAGTNWRRFGLPAQLALLVYCYLLSLGLSANPAALARLLRLITLSGGLAALYGIAQYFGWDPILPSREYHVGEGIWTIVRPPGTLGHAGYFVVYLLHVCSAGVALYWSEPARAWRRAGAVAASLAAVAIVLAGARAGLLGLAAGGLFLALRRGLGLNKRRLVLAAAALLAAGLFYFSPAGALLRARARWFREDPYGGGRIELWADTLRLARSRWLTGYGPETFSSQFPRFQSESLARRFPDRYYESPHNIFLDALAGQGIFGFAAAAMLCGLGLSAVRGSREPRASALAAGLVSALAANQFVVFTAPTALFFYLTVAALTAAPATAAPGRSPVLARAAALLFAAAGFSVAWTDFWLARTRRSLDQGDLPRAMHLARRARRFAIPGTDLDLWYSRALFAASRQGPALGEAWREAFAAARRAADTSEQRPNAYYNLAAFYSVQNDFPGAERSLRAAIEGAPNWYKPHWMLALVLHQAGRRAEAAVEAKRAAALNAGKNPEVAETWQRLEPHLPK